MRTKLLTVAVVSAAALLTPSVALANWVHISTSSDRQYFIDNSNVERRGDTVSYWQQDVFAVPLQGSTKSITAYFSADCASQVNRMHWVIRYNSAGIVIADGKLSEQQSPLQEIISGTHKENVYEAVCSNW